MNGTVHMFSQTSNADPPVHWKSEGHLDQCSSTSLLYDLTTTILTVPTETAPGFGPVLAESSVILFLRRFRFSVVKETTLTVVQWSPGWNRRWTGDINLGRGRRPGAVMIRWGVLEEKEELESASHLLVKNLSETQRDTRGSSVSPETGRYH